MKPILLNKVSMRQDFTPIAKRLPRYQKKPSGQAGWIFVFFGLIPVHYPRIFVAGQIITDLEEIFDVHQIKV